MLPVLFAVLNLKVVELMGHGMALNPVSRGSRWRFNASAPRYLGNFSF
jgi:hypothetical protein